MNGIIEGVLITLVVLAALRALRFGLRRRWGRRARHGFMLRRLLRRIDATPEQERLFQEEVETLGKAMREAREGFSAWQEELARLLEADAADPVVIAEYGSRHLAQLDGLRQKAAGALGRLLGVLDVRQRRILANMLRTRLAHHGC